MTKFENKLKQEYKKGYEKALEEQKSKPCLNYDCPYCIQANDDLKKEITNLENKRAVCECGHRKDCHFNIINSCCGTEDTCPCGKFVPKKAGVQGK